MAKPKLNKKYRCTHSFTHPNLGRMLRKGKLYVCKDIKSNADLITMSGMYGDGVNCSQQFFNDHFEEADTASQPKTLTLTATETVWIKNFFEKHIDEIADLDGGFDYKSLMSVSDKIEKM